MPRVLLQTYVIRMTTDLMSGIVCAYSSEAKVSDDVLRIIGPPRDPTGLGELPQLTSPTSIQQINMTQSLWTTNSYY